LPQSICADRWGWRMFYNNTASLSYSDSERRTNNYQLVSGFLLKLNYITLHCIKTIYRGDVIKREGRKVLWWVCLCLFVCLSVRSHNSKFARPNFAKFLFMLPTAMARSSSGGVAIRYVLPVLWMTWCYFLLAAGRDWDWFDISAAAVSRDISGRRELWVKER